MNPATEARQALAAALQAIDGVTVHAVWPQGAVAPPMAVVRPREPWLRPITLSRTEVNVFVEVAVKAIGSNDSAAAQIEDFVWQATQRMREAGAMVGEASAPTTTEVGSAQLLVSSIEVTVHVSDEG